MLKTTQQIAVTSTDRGLKLRPDVLLVPVQIHVVRPKPEARQSGFEDCMTRLKAIDGITLSHQGYRSWTTKLAGKGSFGRGEQYHLSNTVICRLTIPEEWGFEQRVAALEGLQNTLAGIASEEVSVGEAIWQVSEPQTHLPALVQALKAQVDLITGSFGLQVLGADLSPIRVETISPDLAVLHLDSKFTLGRAQHSLAANPA